MHVPQSFRCKSILALLFLCFSIEGFAKDERFACNVDEFITSDKSPTDFVKSNQRKVFFVTVGETEITVKPNYDKFRIVGRTGEKVAGYSFYDMDNDILSTSIDTIIFDLEAAAGVISFSHIQYPSANNWLLKCVKE